MNFQQLKYNPATRQVWVFFMLSTFKAGINAVSSNAAVGLLIKY